MSTTCSQIKKKSDSASSYPPSHSTMSLIPTKNFSSSFSGLVSSYLRKQTPSCAAAYPKLIFIALAWPICKIPFGSGGNLVLTYKENNITISSS
jgi:hypothetical protein